MLMWPWPWLTWPRSFLVFFSLDGMSVAKMPHVGTLSRWVGVEARPGQRKGEVGGHGQHLWEAVCDASLHTRSRTRAAFCGNMRGSVA